eukprot:840824-Rhodomonas_salina.3
MLEQAEADLQFPSRSILPAVLMICCAIPPTHVTHPTGASAFPEEPFLDSVRKKLAALQVFASARAVRSPTLTHSIVRRLQHCGITAAV